jgi:hypothetical protein
MSGITWPSAKKNWKPAMTEKPVKPPVDHHLANLQNRELNRRAQRSLILKMTSEAALDALLDAPAPATLVQSFPDQDLYFLMHRIGPSDFIPILSLAASDQWEYILDVEVWDGDRLDTRMMTRAFDLLFKADPERFLRWIITEKPDYFEFYLSRHMDIFIREHDEFPPSDFDDYMTLDDKFYFRFPEEKQSDDPDLDADIPLSEDVQAPELIDAMVRKLAEMDLSVFHGLMLETISVLPAETEEEQLRLKTIRLAEKGFLPFHEAIGIYQPTPLTALRKRPKTQIFSSDTFDPDLPLPPQCFTQFLAGDDLFVKALARVPADFIITLESELAALINKVVSADRLKIRDTDALAKIIRRTGAYLSLGLESVLQENISLEAAADLIQTYYLEDLFRTGSRAGIQLKTAVKNWYTNSFVHRQNLPLGFLGESFLGIMGGLMLDRPMYFDNYASGELYRPFASLSDIHTTRQAVDRIMGLDGLLARIDPDIASFKKGVLTYKSLILTLWAKDRLGLAPDLSPIDTAAFKPFFTALFAEDPGLNPPASRDRNAGDGTRTGPDRHRDIRSDDLSLWASQAIGMNLPAPVRDLLQDLVKEIREDYATVHPERIDPRFMPHFLLTRN